MSEIDLTKIEPNRSLAEWELELKGKQAETLTRYGKISNDLDGCRGNWDYGRTDFDCDYYPKIECDHCVYGGGFRHPVTGKDLRKVTKPQKWE